MYTMKTFLRRKSLLAVSLLLTPGLLGSLTGCQAVEGYGNRLVSMFTGLLDGLVNAIRFPSFR